ncbi:P63C domain-containing protein [Nitrosospira multiformis]|uniref:P63C domain-containing protein n=1 Tax=Nitrosospira multiformis TaxID=1231 RepID=UPI0008984EC7|nr:P63C domain-containing protein [Nitrosospira multiformis]SEA74256.1 P63C domain-containing protein [Nitrosospira multiformis]
MEKKNKSKAVGGIARANSLTSEQRREIAEKAAAARWGSKPFHATHKGNFKEEFGIDVDCYVLNDNNKTAVISKRGMGAALGLGDGGSALQRFTSGKTISATLGVELIEKINNPLIFKASTLGANSAYLTVHGYDVTILIDICKAIINAQENGKLLSSQANIARQAQIIVSASAKAGIQGLVYALAGYDRTKEEVIAAFKLYVQEEARKYEKEFPNELYLQWHRLYEIPVPARGKPWQFKHLTVRHIYYPLAKSNGKILELIRALKASDGDRQKKLFQFLNEVGARALRIQIGRVLEMSESSNDKHQYESKIVERFGGQQELELVIT